MPLNSARARQLLKEFNFRSLFRDELGWDNHNGTLQITFDGNTTHLGALAQKRGMVAYQFATPAGECLPDYAMRRKIEQQVAKAAHEHLIIFTDAALVTQIWQWVKREPGKPAACREHTFHKSQSGDALLQKLEAIVFTLDEEETLVLTDVTRRARAGFDVERVTKKFYEQFRKEHGAFLEFIEGFPPPTKVEGKKKFDPDHEWYASVMLNRLMFVYFIQRKGFLDGDRDYLRNRLQRCQQEHGKDKFYTFYRIFLLRLFHEGFGKRRKDRAPDLEKLIGNIPYLNGGLFDVHELEKPERYGKDIKIEDKAFERIFNYFDQYQWHLDERPLRADNEINPDVLGYIFEKYINQKQMGAYYTKEDITEYISKNTVIPFLFDAARAKCKVAFENLNGPTVWDLLRENPDRYIYDAVKKGVELALPKEIAAGIKDVSKRGGWNKPAPSEFALPTEIWREVVARRQRYFELRARLSGETLALTPALSPGERENRSPSLGKSSASISPDAGCYSPSPPSEGGEGRGEVGRLPPITDINDFITLNLDLRQFAQDVIENCEGPDLLMAFWQAISNITVLDPTGGSGAFIFAALNILEPLYEASLDRMEVFLTEWGETGKKAHPNYHKKFTEVLARVDAHPNRRYFVLKSITINNLYAVDIMEEAVEICKLRLFLKLAAQVEPDADKDNLGIEPLPDIDFNIRAGNTLVGYATKEEVQRCMKELGGGQMKLMGEEELGSFARFNTRCADVEQAFSKFRQLQTEGDGSVPAADKQELQKRLKALEDELNRHLATEYGVKVSDKAAYAKWVKSHQPFHWFIHFYGILNRGGFDVIVGNPPWVEFAKVQKAYSLRGFSTIDCNNLWAFVVERSYVLLGKGARHGLIIPMSLVCTERMLPIQQIVKSAGSSWLANFESDSNPGQLFDGVKQNVTILIGKHEGEMQIWTTKLFRFFQEYRDFVFPTVEFVRWSGKNPLGFGFPKVSTDQELRLISKMFAKNPLATQMTTVGSQPILVHRIAHYYIKCFDFVPHFKSERDGVKKSEDYKEYLFHSPVQKYVAAINSTAFYFYWQVFFDAFKAGKLCVESFPLGNPNDSGTQDELVSLAKRLMRDMKSNSTRLRAEYAATGRVEYDQFYPRHSKPILDKIDTVLAGHYGFTAEELDFILNYDIKYRLGRATEAEEE